MLRLFHMTVLEALIVLAVFLACLGIISRD